MAALEAKLAAAEAARKTAESAQAFAEAASAVDKAKATKSNAKKNLYKQQLANEKDKADKVQSPPPDDASTASRLASELAKLIGRKSASASFIFLAVQLPSCAKSDNLCLHGYQQSSWEILKGDVLSQDSYARQHGIFR